MSKINNQLVKEIDEIFLKENSWHNGKFDKIQQNVIIGSLLGDGSLALYGRSKNAHYREHGGDSQIEYRKWKAKVLNSLGFKFSDRGKYGKIYSPSLEIFTELYQLFYINRVKTITYENLKLLNHPIGLACLYMDDGSLTITPAHKKKSIHLSPQVTIYTLSFSKKENIIVQEYLNHVFQLNFILKRRPDGQNYVLGINKQNDVIKFLQLVKPFVEPIKCMHHKINLQEVLESKRNEFQLKYPNKSVNLPSLNVVDHTYTKDYEQLIINMKNLGCQDKEVANKLNRSYWGVVDKIRRLRAENKF